MAQEAVEIVGATAAEIVEDAAAEAAVVVGVAAGAADVMEAAVVAVDTTAAAMGDTVGAEGTKLTSPRIPADIHG